MEQIDEEVMGGWPIYKYTLREILENLGAIDCNGILGFKNDDKTLDRYPRTLEDDGMGYGINEKYICDVGKDIKDNNINFFINPDRSSLIKKD